jgi:cytoskeletal protein RodZ
MSPSKAVYRRRRLVFFGGIILLLAVIAVAVWLVIAQPWADAASGGPVKTPSASPSETSAQPTPEKTTDTPEPTETEAGPAPCRAADVIVEAVTDAESYQSGTNPQLSISLTNGSSTDCTIDVGSATQVFTVASGEDVWWRSTDCQENPSSMVVTLKAGQEVTSAEPITWDRTRSNVGTCDDENRPRAPGGGASYHVAVSIGGFDAVNTRQILLY